MNKYGLDTVLCIQHYSFVYFQPKSDRFLTDVENFVVSTCENLDLSKHFRCTRPGNYPSAGKKRTYSLSRAPGSSKIIQSLLRDLMILFQVHLCQRDLHLSV